MPLEIACPATVEIVVEALDSLGRALPDGSPATLRAAGDPETVNSGMHRPGYDMVTEVRNGSARFRGRAGCRYSIGIAQDWHLERETHEFMGPDAIGEEFRLKLRLEGRLTRFRGLLRRADGQPASGVAVLGELHPTGVEPRGIVGIADSQGGFALEIWDHPGAPFGGRLRFFRPGVMTDDTELSLPGESPGGEADLGVIVLDA